MTFRDSISWLFGSAPTPASAERTRQLNASMDEFVRLLHTNGYDDKGPAPDEVTGLPEQASRAEDARPSNRGS